MATQASSVTPADAKDQIPFCDDQGFPNLTGAYLRGMSVQHATFEMVSSPDDFVFVTEGLSDMADDTYVVLVQNQTDETDPATVSAKTAKQFTINGPDIGDVVDIVIMGTLKEQLA